MAYHPFVSRVTRRVPHVEQELIPFQSTWVHPSMEFIHCYSNSSLDNPHWYCMIRVLKPTVIPLWNSSLETESLWSLSRLCNRSISRRFFCFIYSNKMDTGSSVSRTVSRGPLVISSWRKTIPCITRSSRCCFNSARRSTKLSSTETS